MRCGRRTRGGVCRCGGRRYTGRRRGRGGDEGGLRVEDLICRRTGRQSSTGDAEAGRADREARARQAGVIHENDRLTSTESEAIGRLCSADVGVDGHVARGGAGRRAAARSQTEGEDIAHNRQVAAGVDAVGDTRGRHAARAGAERDEALNVHCRRAVERVLADVQFARAAAERQTTAKAVVKMNGRVVGDQNKTANDLVVRVQRLQSLQHARDGLCVPAGHALREVAATEAVRRSAYARDTRVVSARGGIRPYDLIRRAVGRTELRLTDLRLNPAAEQPDGEQSDCPAANSCPSRMNRHCGLAIRRHDAPPLADIYALRWSPRRSTTLSSKQPHRSGRCPESPFSGRRWDSGKSPSAKTTDAPARSFAEALQADSSARDSAGDRRRGAGGLRARRRASISIVGGVFEELDRCSVRDDDSGFRSAARAPSAAIQHQSDDHRSGLCAARNA